MFLFAGATVQEAAPAAVYYSARILLCYAAPTADLGLFFLLNLYFYLFVLLHVCLQYLKMAFVFEQSNRASHFLLGYSDVFVFKLKFNAILTGVKFDYFYNSRAWVINAHLFKEL